MYRYRIPQQVLPIGDAAKPPSFATRSSEFVVSLPHPFSIVTTASQLFSDHLNLSSSLCNSSQSCSISPLLSSALFTSSLLFSTLPNDSHLCPPRLHSSQLASTLFTSCHVLNSSHLFSALIKCSHLFLSSCLKASHLLNSGQLFSTLFTSRHSVKDKEMLTQVKLSSSFELLIFFGYHLRVMF